MNQFLRAMLLTVSAALALGAFPAIATAELFTPLEETGNWDVDCNQTKCLVGHEELPGANRRIELEIIGAAHTIESVHFVLTGNIDENDGFVAVFMRTQVDANRTECKEDKSPLRLPHCYSQVSDAVFAGSFVSCHEELCVIQIRGQYANDQREKEHVDLIQQFEKDDLMLFLFKDNKGNLRRQALDISGFQEAYQVALKHLK